MDDSSSYGYQKELSRDNGNSAILREKEGTHVRSKGIVWLVFITRGLFLLGIVLVLGGTFGAFGYAHSDEPADVLDVILRPYSYAIDTGWGFLALAVILKLGLMLRKVLSDKK